MNILHNQDFPIHGWIFIDKPIGISSNRILQKVRSLFLRCKAGYVGTLDPMASGFLPLALGKATKTIQYLNENKKEYVFTVTWGKKTSTGDVEGEIIEENKLFPKEDEIKLRLINFLGNIEQIPPKFSAIKVNGERAYKLARLKEKFEMSPRKVKIFDLKHVKTVNSKETQFFLKCSSGTYVRTLAEDLAKSLGTVCYLSDLRRVGFGNLDKKLISLDYLVSLMHIDKLIKVLKPVDYVFKDMKFIDLKLEEAKLLIDGKFIELTNRAQFQSDNDFIIAKYEEKLIVIGKLVNGFFYPKNVMNLSKQ